MQKAKEAYAEKSFLSSVKRGYYTDEKILAARHNIKSYEWAKKIEDRAVSEAEKYVGRAEQLWEMVTPQSIPRGITIGYINDPEAWLCPYCKTDLRANYANYPWLTDPLNDPWKIQCPACKRKFPSNDFGKYYKSGLDEHGIFNPEIADKNLLTNDLYPEKGPGWGVDDGYGFITGNRFPNGVVENKTFIAYYNHFGLWLKTDDGINPGILVSAIGSLRDAYLFTGDIKYARTGLIILDRIADLYPTYDLYPYRDYYNSHGMSWEGKLVGREWETFIATDLSKAVDAFRPVMGDGEVIAFLSEKAKKLKLDNKKESASDIAENIDSGILREIFKAVKNAQIYGNFGMHQQSLAMAAVALNKMPETGEWIDYVFKPGGYTGDAPDSHITGGNVMSQLVDHVDRDGFGNEGAPGYNLLWISNLIGVADALDGYALYPKGDLYKNPKFAKMFDAFAYLIMCSKYTPSIGDSGSTANAGILGNLSAVLKGFCKFRTEKLARFACALKNNSSEDIAADIFTPDPGKIWDEIESVAGESGKMPYKSENLAGYGFAALRDGDCNPSADSQRAFSIYYGRTTAHGHKDMLNLGVYSFGIDLAPDLGYPEATGINQNRLQWVQNTISHNTVAVNRRGQNIIYGGKARHFDDAGIVKVMDIEAPQAYDDMETYRRSVIMVKIDDNVSYGVDFFHVKGGCDHVFSFHAQSNKISRTSGLNLTAQKDPAGNYTGTYEGPDAKWGEAVKNQEVPTAAETARAESGYSWLSHVEKDIHPGRNFSVDWEIEDFRNLYPGRKGIHLCLRSLNENAVSDVSIADGMPPRIKGNPGNLKYLLIHREGGGLDTLFTSVIEPYQYEQAIANAEFVPVKASESCGPDYMAKAVKVTFKNGRTDYIVCSENSKLLYNVDNKFDFRGFTGVYSEKNGKPLFSYINDGDAIGDIVSIPEYTGEIFDFTRELSDKNSIKVRFGGHASELRLDDLPGRYIYIGGRSDKNACYKIYHAEADNGYVNLDIGDSTTIGGIETSEKTNEKYKYIMETGDLFTIPLSKLCTDFN